MEETSSSLAARPALAPQTAINAGLLVNNHYSFLRHRSRGTLRIDRDALLYFNPAGTAQITMPFADIQGVVWGGQSDVEIVCTSRTYEFSLPVGGRYTSARWSALDHRFMVELMSRLNVPCVKRPLNIARWWPLGTIAMTLYIGYVNPPNPTTPTMIASLLAPGFPLLAYIWMRSKQHARENWQSWKPIDFKSTTPVVTPN